MSNSQVAKPASKDMSSHRAWLTVGIIGSIASLISIPMAAYFYAKSREYPQLTYLTHPIKAELLRAGKVSKLKASFEDKPVETDVTTAQLAFWNQGTQSIKGNNILKPIVIYTDNGTPIFEATVRKVSRDVINLKLGVEDISKGRVNVTWNILEPGDGAVLQIIYAGPQTVAFNLDGVIEGQKEIRQQRFAGKIKSPEEQYDAERKRDRTFILVLLILSVSMILLNVLLRRSVLKLKAKHRVVMDYDEVDALVAGDEDKIKELESLKKSVLESRTETPTFLRFVNVTTLVGFVMGLIGIGVAAVIYIVWQQPGPPFGF